MNEREPIPRREPTDPLKRTYPWVSDHEGKLPQPLDTFVREELFREQRLERAHHRERDE